MHLSELTVQGQISAQCLWFTVGHVHLAQVFTKCTKLLPWLLTLKVGTWLAKQTPVISLGVGVFHSWIACECCHTLQGKFLYVVWSPELFQGCYF